VSGIALHLSHASVACVPPAEDEILASEEVPLIECVLVPTDLSPASNTAALHAYALLGSGGGEIVLAHVAAEDAERGAEPHIIAELRSLLSRHPSRGNVTIRTEVVRHRDVATAICELAERVGADAICMASHGRDGLKRALLGSVAEAVMRQTRQPVLVVRPPPP
jgi:nucleotide-binding universal stress UspA family protein